MIRRLLLSLQPYVFTIRNGILLSLTFRAELLTAFFAETIMMLTTAALWATVYRGGDPAALKKMMAWAVLGSALAAFGQGTIQSRIPERIRAGQIAIDLIRPVRLPLLWAAEDLGTMLSRSLTHVLPILVVGGWLLGVPRPASASSAIVALVAMAVGIAILWLLSALTALIAFWSVELGNLVVVKDVLVRLLSGLMVPLWFFPSSIRSFVEALPFASIYQAPLEIWTGTMGGRDLEAILLRQAFWVVLLGASFAFLWNRAARRVLVQGG